MGVEEDLAAVESAIVDSMVSVFMVENPYLWNTVVEDKTTWLLQHYSLMSGVVVTGVFPRKTGDETLGRA